VHDEDYAEWERFLFMLSQFYGERPQLGRQILDDAAANQTLRDALPSTPNGGSWTTRALGDVMSAHAGRWYDGFTLQSCYDKHSKVQRWQVSKVDRS